MKPKGGYNPAGRPKEAEKNAYGLTDKQERFVREYLIDSNATQAAIRAGYAMASASVMASELLAKANIQNRMRDLQARIANKLDITAERVVAELARIGFADARKTMAWGPDGVTLIDSASLTDDDARAVAEVSQSTTKDGGSIRIKHHDKVAALEKLGKHLGLFRDVVEQINREGAPAWDLSRLDADELATLERLRAKCEGGE